MPETEATVITDAQRKRVFVIIFISIMVTMIGVGNIAPFLPIYARELGATGMMVGLIFSGFSIARLFSMPLFGRWSDRKGRKPFIAAGFLVYTLVSVAFIFADKAWHLMVIRFAQGFSAAMIIPIAMAYVGDVSRLNHEARSMNAVNVALFLGFGIGPLSGGLIHDFAGISYNFAGLGIASLAAFFLVVFALPNLNIAGIVKNNRSGKPTRYRDIIGESDIMKGILIHRMATSAGRGMIIAFLPLFADEKVGLSAMQIGLVITANLMFSSLLQIVFAKNADHGNRRNLVLIGNVFSIATLAMLPFAANFWEFLVINLGNGVAGAIAMPAASGIVVTEGRKFGMGVVMALFNIGMSIGLASGPLMAGFVSDHFSINLVFYCAAIIVIFGTIAFWRYTAKVPTEFFVNSRIPEEPKTIKP